MAINLSNLRSAKGAKKSKRRVGRGGKRGTYSGRGMKGQRARSGGKGGLKLLGLKQTLLRIPKKRGFRSLKAKLTAVSLARLAEEFENGGKVDKKKMIRAGLVANNCRQIKVLGGDKLNVKLEITADAFSASAKEAIEAAGGSAKIAGK